MKTTNQVFATDPSLLSSASVYKNDAKKAENLSTSNAQPDTTESSKLSNARSVNQAEKIDDKSTQKQSEEVEKAELKEAISTVHKFIDNNKRGVSFSIDDSTDRTVIKVIDKHTNETVKQMPSEEFLKIAEKIKALETDFSSKVGMLIDGIA